MILFFDTETTGKVDFNRPPADPSQPRMVQIAAVLVDANGRIKSSLNLICRPDGWEVPDEASRVHGLTTGICRDCGVPVGDVLRLFNRLAERATIAVAHNIAFDLEVLRGELIRDGLAGDSIERCKHVCTMQLATPVCEIPGRRGFKWPSLAEAHRHLIGSDFDGAHDAMADVLACMRCYFALQNLGRAA